MRMIIVWGWPILSKLSEIRFLANWTIKHFIEAAESEESEKSLNLSRVWVWMDEPRSDLRAEWAQGRSICVRHLCVWERIWYVLYMDFRVKFVSVCVGLSKMDQIHSFGQLFWRLFITNARFCFADTLRRGLWYQTRHSNRIYSTLIS